jgi:hypothetical protein
MPATAQAAFMRTAFLIVQDRTPSQTATNHGSTANQFRDTNQNQREKEMKMNRFESYSKRLMWLIPCLLTAFAAGCGGGGEGRDPILGAGFTLSSGTIIPGAVCTAAAGPTIPTVTMSEPTSGNQFATTSTSGVAGTGKLITATFSLAMNPATINATTFTLTPVGGTAMVPASVSYNASTKVATLTTSSALLPNTSYTAAITKSATSALGIPIGCIYAWTFKTATPAATGLAPVNLGLATPFAIAARAGITTTSVGATINGDAVLADPTPTCNAIVVPGGSGTAGFGACAGTAPTISGTVITPTFPDTTTASAVMADLVAAYNSITPANLPGATVLGCGTIGSAGGAGAGVGCAGNATLPPGVYISATASTIGVTGVLTLDGKGDENARFVFQAPSALTTAAGAPGAPGSQIVLIGGAKASNVWWQVGSSATIGTFSDMQGNVLADTSVTMGTDSKSCGRMLAGAVTNTGLIALQGAAVASVPGNTSAPAACQ